MLTKHDVYKLLEEKKIEFEAFEHTPVYTIEEMNALNLPNSEGIVKNLFLRDDKKLNYYLITMPGNKPADLKAYKDIIPSRRLSFANKEELEELLQVEQGHVTPLGVLNNAEGNVTVVFDSELDNQLIGIHPMENTATIFVNANDIVKLIEDHGHKIVIRDL